jgi:acyl-coenzyme A thioesterase PaaI-like protein
MPSNDDQRQQLLRITRQLSSILETSQTLGGSNTELDQLESSLNQLIEQVKPLGNRKMLEFFNADYGDDLRKILPCSPVSGYFNPIAPEFKIYQKDNIVYADGHFSRMHEGPPDCVHGGMLSAFYDQVLAFTGIANQTPGMTASLTVKYRRPTPLFKSLRFSCWVEKISGRNIIIHGECHCDDELLSSSEGLFIFHEQTRSSTTFNK